MVVDIRPDDRIPEKDAGVFAVTAAACAAAGWEFRRRDEADPVLVANVRWLSRYRHPRCAEAADIAAVLLKVFAGGQGLFAGADLAGERLRVLPVLFHLMWRRHLVADLAVGPLGLPVPIRLQDVREDLDFRELAHKCFIADARAALVSDADVDTVWRQLCQDDKIVVPADGLEEALTESATERERDNLIRLAVRQANEQRLPLIIVSRPDDSLRSVEATTAAQSSRGEPA